MMTKLLIPMVLVGGFQFVAMAADFTHGGNISFPGARRTLVSDRADYAQGSFQAEVTVTIRGGAGEGAAFFGLGAGVPDAARFNEPTTAPSLTIRMGPSDFADGRVLVAVNGAPVGENILLGSGTHRLRLSWDAPNQRAWIDFHRDWQPTMTFAPSQSLFLAKVDANFSSAGHLFMGGGADVAFQGFSLRKLSAKDIASLPVSDTFPDDPSARTWLPVGKPNPADEALRVTREADSFLAPMRASLRPLVCWYADSTLLASRTLADGALKMPGSRWNLAIDSSPVTGQSDARDLTITFTLRNGNASSTGVAAAIDFAEWDSANYVMLPAAVYQGNRLRTVNRSYAAGLDPSDYYRKDLPLTQGDIPRLAIDPKLPSKLEVSANNVATPAICVFSPRLKRAFIVLTEQAARDAAGNFIRKSNGEVLDNGFAVEESADRSRATLVISAPGVRERKPEFLGFSASPDRGTTLKPGDPIHLKLRVISFPATGIPDVLERFMSSRKDLTGPNHPRKLVPASQVAQWMTTRIDSRFLQQGAAKFYCPENGPWLAFGWIGGWINTFPMLVHGDGMHRERVAQTIDFGLAAQCPSGYFHYAIRADGNTTFRDPAADMTMARTSGDTLFWMIKQFLLLKAQGQAATIKPAWEDSMKRLADALVNTWDKHQQWGKLINVKTGDVGEFNTTGGAMIIGGLALASDYFKNPRYLQVAKDAAEFYYQRDFVQLGFTSGACADILQNADSETAAGFMTAMMALHEVSGDPQWLEKSRHLANLTATWTVSHDYELPRFTELGALDAKLAGVVWASTQNKHGAPGICTSSGDPLFKIYRSTGDTRYAELLRDIIAAHGESIRPGGFTNERLTFCDADSRGSRGNHVTGWNETNGILMAQEIPGIYLRTDLDRSFVFDAVNVQVTRRSANDIGLTVFNPTAHDAEVSILAENAARASKPLGYNALLRWPKVKVKAGASIAVTVNADGTIRP